MPPWLKKVLSSAEMKALTTSGGYSSIGQLDPPLAGEGLHRIAVIAADVGRQRRLIGEQLLRRRQAGGEEQPDRGEEQEAGRAPPRPARRTQRRSNHGSSRAWTRCVEGDQVGQRRQDGERSAFGAASSGFGSAAKEQRSARSRRAARSASIACGQRSDDRRAALGRASAAPRRRHC